MHVSQEQQYLTMTPLTKTGGLPFTFDIEDSLSDDIRHAPPQMRTPQINILLKHH